MTFRIYDTENHIKMLQDACDWLGIHSGRSRDYVRSLRKWLDEGLSTNSILAAFESHEITDLYRLWEPHAARYPGIKSKLREAVGKGPLLREDEAPASSANSAPRNHAFSLLVAGKLLTAKAKILSVEGIVGADIGHCPVPLRAADIVFRRKSRPYVVECKRPQSSKKLEPRTKEALRQIQKRRVPGMFAIDLSALLRPRGHVLPRASSKVAATEVSKAMQKKATDHSINQFFHDHILGAILFARMPVIVPAANGGDAFRLDTTSSWLGITNASAKKELLSAMKHVKSRLENLPVEQGHG